MGRSKYVQKRIYERIPSSLVVKFYHGKTICYGIVENISEKGMCINSGECLPLNSSVNLLIPLKEEHIKVHGNVKWVARTITFYDAMGVEILKPSRKYLKVFKSLKMKSQ